MPPPTLSMITDTMTMTPPDTGGRWSAAAGSGGLDLIQAVQDEDHLPPLQLRVRLVIPPETRTGPRCPRMPPAPLFFFRKIFHMVLMLDKPL